MNISESTVRLLFDLLHGIKRMDVPFVMALEFAILLGFDGQLEDSDMENELFTSAIDQLKESQNNFKLKRFTLVGSFRLKPSAQATF